MVFLCLVIDYDVMSINILNHMLLAFQAVNLRSSEILDHPFTQVFL